MRKSLFTPLSYLVLALVAASPAVAEPPVPSWQRGDEGATYQMWSFSIESTVPDVWQNDFGSYTEQGIGLSVKEQGWLDSMGDVTGIYALGHEMDIVIPNNPVPNEYKEILIYLIWRPGEDSGPNFEKDPYLPDIPVLGTLPAYNAISYEESVDITGWRHSTYELIITPNPDKEWIIVKGNILVDYLAIDTICVPEPATIIILTFGMLGVIRRRKK